jgi:hypothetical protein
MWVAWVPSRSQELEFEAGAERHQLVVGERTSGPRTLRLSSTSRSCRQALAVVVP